MRKICRIFDAGSKRLVDTAASAASIYLVASFLLAIPQWAQAAIYTVCPLPAVCDFQTPDAAVNDPGIADGDIIDITADNYVLGAPMQVVNNITIDGNGAVRNETELGDETSV